MGTALVVTSGKGGVGKTTTSANIGTALALQGKRVVLLDLDIGLRLRRCHGFVQPDYLRHCRCCHWPREATPSVDQGQTI